MPATRPYNRYQYETSPRKLEPIKNPKRNLPTHKKTTVKNTKKLEEELKRTKKQENYNKLKVVMYLALGFAVLLMIGYRNSQINEAFTYNQKLEKQISNIQKENEQLEVNIQNSLNLSQIEQEAKERLGMQKLNSKQTPYIQLPKKDYVEAGAEHVIVENNSENILEIIINWFKNLF